MPFPIAAIRHRLREGDLARLFIEDLGWDRVGGSAIALAVDGTEYELRPIAQKRDAVVCVAEGIPDRGRRAHIERAMAKVHFEHVIAYVDGTGNQLWQWAKREPGRPAALREHWLRAGQSGEGLAEKLAGLSVSLDEEAELTLTDVTTRLQRSFDTEKVTRAFYDRFKREHGVFLGFISGVGSIADREWYASLMLNRLMFTYFIQKRGFLDGDVNYLGNRLDMMQRRVGPDRFLSFYRHFLLRLFHEGFGQQHAGRLRDLDELLGDVPYLNGGLFEIHELERTYPDIEIPDEAFARVFEFFDDYTWHLDERPVGNDREINPDVLGYIFEKYINQKQAGAYYTKEDISGYMASAAIVPRLLQIAEEKCSIAFRDDGSVWRLLRENPDRYIPDILLRGVDEDLPPYIRAGLDDPNLRVRWDEPAGSEHGFATETWREYLDRRAQVTKVRAALAAGRINSSDDLFTSSLDLRQLAQDAIDNCEGPELLRAFDTAIRGVTVLDPACGSGAFLFAAVNVLEPLYEACLDRMQSFIDEPGPNEPTAFDDFRSLLARVAEHPNSRYFVLKSIIIENLYGVDIMEEAVEICKLRLFLKLVSVVGGVEELEPLPDVDFNVRTGNSLVGYTTQAAVTEAISSRLDFDDALKRITDSAAEAAAAFDRFRALQTEGQPSSGELAESKAELRGDMEALRANLDREMASAMAADTSTRAIYAWVAAHRPFHWLVEFYGIMKDGGFDVVVGNPPYVGLPMSGISEACGIGMPFGRLFSSYATVTGGNLYALFVERSLSLIRTGGRWSLVVPLSITFGREFAALRELVAQSSRKLWYASFDNIPDRVFTGAKESENTSKANQQRVTVCVGSKGGEAEGASRKHMRGTPIMRWRSSERVQLLASLPYVEVSELASAAGWPKIGADSMSRRLLRAVGAWPRIESLLVDSSVHRLVVPRTAGYYVAAYEDPKDRSKQMTLSFRDAGSRDLAQVVLNSNMFFFWYRVWGDGFDVTRSLVASCPIPPAPRKGVRALARALSNAQAECTVYKGYRGVDVPNVNYNTRMDLLLDCDRWLWSHLEDDSELPWRDLLRYKSSSWFSFEIAKSQSWPEPFAGLGMRTAEGTSS